MTDKELIQALRENAEWAQANEWETPITLSDNLTEAADRLEALLAENDHLREVTKMAPKWVSVEERLPESDELVLVTFTGKKRRLIDENALLKKLERMIDYCKNDPKVNGLTALFQVGDAVMDCPTVDAVEVVFCKDCRWRDEDDDCVNPKCGKSWYGCHVSDEHYCSYGERRCE